ncbi:glycosyltransferase [Roseitranquillus sediminis]|uniref:glycosyltransferase n=1 Tax=Roseitranquillus sediminis TaxID=2809051 RepID=UPI001D0C2F35|nr:glycosyltransferase [Roseitranquillus sediminis]MBM9594015.1 glycosyltransferase [Roseitranquillus sediminis]
MMLEAAPWIVCQIGARENYAVARALHGRGRLAALMTDVWAGGAPLPGRLAERTHPKLRGARVRGITGRALAREMLDRARGRGGWQQILARNAWFQRAAARRLQPLLQGRPGTVFAYSYAAGDILAAARSAGWRTVLGQIDPGPVEARLVDALYAEAGQGGAHEPIPPAYWDAWRRETALADVVLVNSEWSRRALVSEGVPEAKIVTVPLAYEPTLSPHPRTPPAQFDAERPLRLLFLGQVTLRKGIDLALEAMRALPDLPLRLDVVGPLQVAAPDWVTGDRRITLHGPVPRSAVGRFYAEADVFLFPTRSDGFGLTQLEALSAGVPVIASDRCGRVVRDGVNGQVLTALHAGTLAEVLRGLVERPDRIAAWHEAARLDPRFGLDALGRALLDLDDRLQAA